MNIVRLFYNFTQKNGGYTDIAAYSLQINEKIQAKNQFKRVFLGAKYIFWWEKSKILNKFNV